MRPTISHWCVSTLLCISAAGCAGAPGDVSGDAPAAASPPVAASTPAATSAPASTAAATQERRLLWSEELAPGHRVSFYELGSGAQAVMEEGSSGSVPLVQPDLVERGFAALFTQLKPGVAVPATLLASDERHLAASPGAAAVASLAAPVTSAATGDTAALGRPAGGHVIAPDDSRESNWLISTYCNTPAPFTQVRCQSGFDWADSGVTEVSQGSWQSYAYVGHEGSVAASYYGEYYSCWSSGFLGLGSTCGWKRDWTDSIPPGYWHWWYWNNGFGTQYHANVSGAGGGTTVALVLRYAPAINRPPVPAP